MGNKTILIEQTSKRLKRWEFIVTAMLFLTLFAGFGLLHIAVSAAVAAWSISGVCLLEFVGVSVAVWWNHE